jgi:MoaA/NifB/PqqE/SkfB family radical SAM enzyme
MSWKQSLATAVVRQEWLGRPVKRVVRSRLFTQSALYQKWVLAKVARVDANVGNTRPWVLIETTLTCNAACTMCLHSAEDMRGEMTLELYEKLIRECAEWGVKTVSLSVYGEPFADRHWIKRVEIAHKYGLNYRVVSNGSILRPEVLDRMWELGGWEEVIFSVNGFSVESYEKMMPPLKREKIYGNIAAFLERKAKHPVNAPEVRISCVMTQINAHERDEFRAFWSSQPGVDGVLLADVGNWLGKLDLTELSIKGKSKQIAEGAWLAPCPSPWSQLSVLYDGRVVPCCEDHAARTLVIGDANRNSLPEIFMGEELRKLRKEHKSNRRCGHEICGKCQINPPWYQ